MIMEWEDLSKEIKSWMNFLGSFSPTSDVIARCVKGYMADIEGDGGKVYLNSAELRELASACNDVANWLDARSESVSTSSQQHE